LVFVGYLGEPVGWRIGRPAGQTPLRAVAWQACEVGAWWAAAHLFF
jgi:hypothetical protein